MKARYIYAVSAILWMILVAAHYIFHTHSILSGPRNGDLYAYSWSFQAIVFLTSIFPFWLAALCAIIVLEVCYLRTHSQKQYATNKAQ